MVTLMLDEKGLRNLFDQVHSFWIEPEINRRREADRLADGFKIHRCLIKLPNDKEPIVQFNEEVTWTAKAKTPTGNDFTSGAPVFLPQIERIETVERPTVDGRPVAFFYLYWNGLCWQLIFDCTPNVPDYKYEPPKGPNWTLGEAIAESINIQLKELAVHMHDAHQTAIRSIGLWAAPALMPYPLSAIADECQKGNDSNGRTILVQHCNSDFLGQMTARWSEVRAFVDRRALFAGSLMAHQNRQYALSVHTLVPQIEGVITDWVYSQIPPADVPFKQESKTKKFRDVVRGGAPRTYTDHRIAESIVDFILNGPVLSIFPNWLTSVQDEFPNRHVIGHGKYVQTLFSEENSIKAFLVLDTLYHIMNVHDSTGGRG